MYEDRPENKVEEVSVPELSVVCDIKEWLFYKRQFLLRTPTKLDLFKVGKPGDRSELLLFSMCIWCRCHNHESIAE